MGFNQNIIKSYYALTIAESFSLFGYVPVSSHGNGKSAFFQAHQTKWAIYHQCFDSLLKGLKKYFPMFLSHFYIFLPHTSKKQQQIDVSHWKQCRLPLQLPLGRVARRRTCGESRCGAVSWRPGRGIPLVNLTSLGWSKSCTSWPMVCPIMSP